MYFIYVFVIMFVFTLVKSKSKKKSKNKILQTQNNVVCHLTYFPAHPCELLLQLSHVKSGPTMCKLDQPVFLQSRAQKSSAY